MLARLKQVWGSGESRGFKLAAWGVALCAAGGYHYFVEDKRTASIKEAAKRVGK